jgi:phenylalanyl-tRNA synthetase beta chain
VERRMLAVMALSGIGDRPVFFTVKGILEGLLEKLDLADVSIHPFDSTAEPSPLETGGAGMLDTYHPGRRALLRREGMSFGFIAELNPKLMRKAGVDFHTTRAAVFELDTDILRELAGAARAEKRFQPIPRFPGVTLGLAVVVKEPITAREVQTFVTSIDDELVKEVHLLDIYRGSPLVKGKKSLAFSIVYRKDDRTLTEKEATAVHESIARKVRERGWELR